MLEFFPRNFQLEIYYITVEIDLKDDIMKSIHAQSITIFMRALTIKENVFGDSVCDYFD